MFDKFCPAQHANIEINCVEKNCLLMLMLGAGGCILNYMENSRRFDFKVLSPIIFPSWHELSYNT